MNRPWIVIWSIGTSENLVDHWEVRESEEDANRKYDELIQDPEVYTASICIPIRSTDYDTTPTNLEAH